MLISSCNLISSNDTSSTGKNSLDRLDSKSVSIQTNQKFASKEFIEEWGIRKKRQWGFQNLSIIQDSSGSFDRILRVRYPKDSASPSVARKNKVPIGGGQFFADLGIPPQNSLKLSYYIRFSENFDFVKGGKLPGLFGGERVSGGKVPDGTNGFSTRFMWRKKGDGEVYAYLPTSKKYGTSIGRGEWRFIPGRWYRLEQEVTLNKPGSKNGRIRVWLDGKKVLDQKKLTFRTTDKLKIEGIFFSTFFGGGDASWATPKDVFVDFAQFSVRGYLQKELSF